MKYPFFCDNDVCTDYTVIKEIEMKMSEYNPVQICKKCGMPMKREITSMVCGLAIDKTNSFYRKCN